jgi:hypothetical protein
MGTKVGVIMFNGSTIVGDIGQHHWVDTGDKPGSALLVERVAWVE